MFLQIVFIAIIAILSCWYIYFCYRRFKQQKIIEWWIPNNKLRIFRIWICIIAWAAIWWIIYWLSLLFIPSSTNTLVTNQPTSGASTQNTENNWGLFVGSWAILSWWVEDTWEIESRTTIREKLKYVPVTEKRWSSAQ